MMRYELKNYECKCLLFLMKKKNTKIKGELLS